MAKSLLDSLLDQIFDADWIGKRGEKLTERELRLVNFFGREGKILKNVYIPKSNGETSEIDVLYITQKGIFVIESKNYSGWVFGDEKSRYWTVSLPNKEKHKLYNPIMQNKTHMKWLGEYLKEDVPMFSLIVFSERCELKKLIVSNESVKVIKRDFLYGTIRRIWDNASDVLNETQIGIIYEMLLPLTNVDEAVKRAHVERIQHTFRSDPAKQPSDVEHKVEEHTRLCPRCGGRLLVRTAKKGSNAGNLFYGCANYPNCRYTEQI